MKSTRFSRLNVQKKPRVLRLDWTIKECSGFASRDLFMWVGSGGVGWVDRREESYRNIRFHFDEIVLTVFHTPPTVYLHSIVFGICRLNTQVVDLIAATRLCCDPRLCGWRRHDDMRLSPSCQRHNLLLLSDVRVWSPKVGKTEKYTQDQTKRIQLRLQSCVREYMYMKTLAWRITGARQCTQCRSMVHV